MGHEPKRPDPGAQSEGDATTEPDLSAFETAASWRAGAVAGAVATVAMGLAIVVTDLATLRVAIAGLYGFEGTLAAGWATHLVHGTLFGVLFALVLSDPGIHRVSESVPKTVVAGLVYGLVLAVVAAGIIMPMWLGVAGVDAEVSMPNVTTASLAWHAVFGVVLGGLFPFVEGALAGRNDAGAA